MSIDDLLRDLAGTIARMPDSTAAEAHQAYLRACQQFDEDPAEEQRIADIADLLDAEETLYAQACAVGERGDTATAIPLLRKCAEVGTGEAAWLLAQLLEETGDTAEAMIWYQHASNDGDDRADEKLAVLHLRSCPLAGHAGSPREQRTEVPDPTAQVLSVSRTPALDTWTERAPLSAAAAGHTGQAADVSGSYPGLLDWLVLEAPHHAGAFAEKPLNTDVVPLIFSGPDSDHLTSAADLFRAIGEARNCLAHGISQAKADNVTKLIKMLRAPEPALVAKWRLLVLWHSPGVSKTLAAAERALRWRQGYEAYSRPCPASLAWLYAEGQPETRWAAREPVVANVMLPSAEMPACSPDTTVTQALEQLVHSGTQALPVCEMTRVTGIVTLADLARHISGHQGLPAATETIRTLMRPAAIVPPSTPLSAIAKAIADDGIIVVSGSGDQPDGYLTPEALLAQAVRGTSAHRAGPDRSPLLIPVTGAVLLNRRPLAEATKPQSPVQTLIAQRGTDRL